MRVPFVEYSHGSEGLLQNEYLLLKIAEELIDESAILLLDEFMLPDIAAAKIVKALFTLPKAPELYSADFKKSQFRSFYDIVQARSTMTGDIYFVRNLRHPQRQRMIRSSDTGCKAKRVNWRGLRQSIRKESTTSELLVYGRALKVPWQKDRIALLTFDLLCDVPLAGADYITLASTYHTLVLDGPPQLPVIKKNQARRLTTLLDALYECRVRLIIRAIQS
ncbi:ATPase [Lipomyces mesembrius]